MATIDIGDDDKRELGAYEVAHGPNGPGIYLRGNHKACMATFHFSSEPLQKALAAVLARAAGLPK